MAANANATVLAGLFDPEVVGQRIEKKLFKYMKFAPLANVYTNLEGRPGSTVKLPFFNALSGGAAVVPEGQDIPIRKLTEDTVEVSIHKIGIGVEITDESVLSGYGDIAGEAIDQMTKSIAAKVDDDLLAEAAKVVNSTEKQEDDGKILGKHITLSATFKPDDVADALVQFGEDIDGAGQVIVVNPATYAILRKANDWIPNTEMGAAAIMSGVVGSIYGCQVVVSEKITSDLYIVRPGALAVYIKRETLVEADRDIVAKTTVITADKHFATYLQNPDKLIRITLAA